MEKKNWNRIINYLLIILCIAIPAYTYMDAHNNYKGSVMTKAEYEQVQQQKRLQEAEDEKKLPEFKESFNTVMSNTIGPVYAGCRIGNFQLADIYIKPAWYTLTEEQRAVIIERVCEC